MRVDRRARRSLAGLLAAIALTLISASLATAKLPPHSGHYGPHWLRDSAEYPGVICTYDLGEPVLIQKMRVRPPIVQAYDSGPGVQTQKVGWKLKIFQQVTPGGVYEPLYTSHLDTGLASETTPAPLSAQTYTRFGTNPSFSFRIEVHMFWFRKDGTVSGKATDEPLNSEEDWLGGPSYLGGTCYGEIT